jgi:hypothetical protein
MSLPKIRASLAVALMLSAGSISVARADAQAPESASDATTPMDREAGNLNPPTDNTLSNHEVQQLQHQGVKNVQPATGPVPAVSGTTPIYSEKGGSAAKTEGTVPDQQ